MKIEQTDLKNKETNSDLLEKNLKVEKPDSVRAKEYKAEYMKNLENAEYYSTYKERLAQTPTENTGKWTGERGNSTFIPHDENAQKELKAHGVDGIEYKDGIADFSSVAKETVEIDMIPNRSANFRKADKACAEKWNQKNFEGKNNWTIDDVKAWRQKNNYTWHECIDSKHCELVPTSIHSKCGHVGGYSECVKREKNN